MFRAHLVLNVVVATQMLIQPIVMALPQRPVQEEEFPDFLELSADAILLDMLPDLEVASVAASETEALYATVPMQVNPQLNTTQTTAQSSSSSFYEYIWQIGKFDGAYAEFHEGNDYIEIFDYYVDTNPDDEINSPEFPAYLHTSSKSLGYWGAETIQIHFNLAQSTNATLIYDRNGSEINIISIDDEIITELTGPGENSDAVFQISLGNLSTGSHTLKIEYQPGTSYNNSHFIGAIALATLADIPKIDVDTTDDTIDSYLGDGICEDENGNCSLRAAVMENNFRSSPSCTSETTIIQLGAETYTLSRGGWSLEDYFEYDDVWRDLDISCNVTVVGAGAQSTIVATDGIGQDSESRVFQIAPEVDVTIANITIQNGWLREINGSSNEVGGGISNHGDLLLVNSIVKNNRTGGCGAGIFNNGTLTVNNVEIVENDSGSVGGSGGGLCNEGTATLTNVAIRNNEVSVTQTAMGGGLFNSGELTLSNGVISGNLLYGSSQFQGRNGAGLYNEGTATLTNVTVSGNTASGGAKRYGGGIYNAGTGSSLALQNVTIVDNSASNAGSGIFVNGGTVTLSHTIVANNEYDDCDGVITSGGYNIIGDGTACDFNSGQQTGDHVGSTANPFDPVLTELGYYGTNLTLTHAPLPGSPAIDGGAPAGTPGLPDVDQRGVTRPQQGYYDIGAHEVGPAEYYNAVPEWAVVGTGCENYAFCTSNNTPNPINTRTGNNTYSITDLSLPTYFGDLTFTRGYSTFNARDVSEGDILGGVLSPGWYHNYERQLIFDGPGSRFGMVIMQTAGGSRLAFVDHGNDTFTSEYGTNGQLTYSSVQDQYTYTTSQGVEYVFERETEADTAQMVAINSPDGKQLVLSYNQNSQLILVEDEVAERGLQFTYDGNGRLIEVEAIDTDTMASLGRSVEYGYTTAGASYNLTQVTDTRGYNWFYEYSSVLGSYTYTQHYLSKRYEAIGGSSPTDVLMEYIYDANELYESDTGTSYVRAVEEQNGQGETVAALDYDEYETVITDGVGGTTTDTYLARGTIGDMSNDAGGTQQLHDNNFRPIELTNANENTTELSWSLDGANLESVTDALGNEASFVYDSDNNLILVTNADGTKTHFVYNKPYLWDFTAGDYGATANPDYNTNWDEDLLLEQIANYVETPTGSDDENLATTYEYTAAADAPEPANLVRQVTGPDGVSTCYAYNSFGQTTGVYANCDDMNPGTGDSNEDILTEYDYDTLGRLTDVNDPDGDTTHYVYLDGDDRADRVTRHYDPGKAAYEDGWNLTTATFTDTSGRVVATVVNYNEADLPGGGSPQAIDFDGDSVTDATLEISADYPEFNRISYTVYDAAGRVTEMITNWWPGQSAYYLDLYNLSNRTFYDAAGQVVATVRNYSEADLPGGGSPQAIDFDGDSVTDATLEVLPDAPDINQIALTAYDSAGRVASTTINAWPGQATYYSTGGSTYNLTTVYEYDAVGNVLKTIRNYDSSLSSGYSVALDLVPDLVATDDTTIYVDPNAPDRNIITCTEYDELNRPTFTRSACVPGETDYLTNGDNLYNLVNRTMYDDMGRTIASISNYYDDGQGLPLTSEYNAITRTYYDDLGRVEYVVSNFSGDVVNDPVPAYDPTNYPNNNLVTRYYYDDEGHQIATVRNYYDPSGGNLTQSNIEDYFDDGLNLISRTFYDDAGRVEATVNNYIGGIYATSLPTFDSDYPDRNLVTVYFYDDDGEQVATARNYDDTTLSDGELTNGEFDPDRNLITRTYTNSRGQVIATVNNFVGDVVNDPVPTFAPANPDRNLVTNYEYDLLGRRIETVVDRDTDRTSYTEYDVLGRVEQQVANYDDGVSGDSDTNVAVDFTYDLMGRQIEVADPLGNVRATVYNALGQTIESIVDPNGLDLTTTTDYNVAGQVAEQANPEDETVEYTYDNLGRTVEAVVDPSGLELTETTTYDLRGRVETVTDAEGIETHYEYDMRGRLLTVFENYESGENDATWPECQYDSDGVNVCTHYSYDVNGNLTQVTLGNGSVTQYTHDALGRLTRETIDPDGVAIITDYEYDAAGNQTAVIQAPDVQEDMLTTSYTYDGLGRLNSVCNDWNGETCDSEVWNYTYDSFGNRATMASGTDTWTYTYDDLNRLLSVTDPNNELVEYTYDANGNRTNLELDGTPLDLDYAYDAAGRLVSITDPFEEGDPDPEIVYTYDGASRVDTITSTASIANYDYDPAGRLQEILNGVTGDPGSLSSFTYTLDDNGSRTDAIEVLALPGGMAQGGGSYAAVIDDPAEGGALRARPAIDLIQDNDDPTPPPDEEDKDDEEDKSEATEEPSPEAEGTQEVDPTTTPTPTPTPDEDTVGETDTPTPEPEETQDDEATATPTPTPTPEDEASEEPTEEPTDEVTATPTPTATATATDTPTPTPTDTPTSTPTETPSPTSTDTATPTQEPSLEPADELIVTSSKDSGDADLSDGQCDDGGGHCTLRAALEEANARPGPDTITFDLPRDDLTIHLEAALPAITEAVTLDGTSQPGYRNQPVVRVDGRDIGRDASGLVLRGDGSDISGLTFVNFEGAGIIVWSANNTISGSVFGGSPVGVYLFGAGAHDNRVAGNIFGADREGSARAAVVVNGAGDNIISGSQITGSDIGVYLYGAGATGNRVQGNDINSADSINATRLTVGVYLYGATNNAVGGERSGEENQIAGGAYGILVRGSERNDNDLENNAFDRSDQEGQRGRGTDDIVVLEEVQPEPAVEEPAPVDTSAGERRPRMAAALLGQTFTVDSTGEGADDDPGNGDCDTGSGVCTLRAAIQEANATAGLDTIAFNISGSGPHTIQPGWDLPNITDPVIIDGTTEPDYVDSPVIELDGTNVDTGLYILAGNSTVRGLVINRCDAAGIGLASDGNLIEGSYIGTNVSGTSALGNGWVGIYIDGADNNTIGGTTTAARNVISGNGDGIVIYNGSENNVIQGNTIGLDATGSTALGNSSSGIAIEDSPDNTVGGTASGAGNVISGNGNGVAIYGSSASGNVIEGNLIGTDAAGNLWNGILINGAGGTSVVDNTITGNGNGIRLVNEGATGSIIQGNTIGLGAYGNMWEGIYIENAPANTIGGTNPGEDNVISANGGSGIVIEGGDATGNTVQGNIIGLDADRSTARGNGWAGINVNNAPNTTIGGAEAGAGNVISANEVGVAIFYSGATGSLVQNNIIGLDAFESVVLGNLWEGIYLNGARNSTVSGNHIAGSDVGILVNGDENATGNALRGNAISGNDYLGIDLGDNGVTANDAGDADSGPNGYQNFPVLTSAAGNSTSTTVEGTLNSTANTQFTIDFYASAAADPSGYGEGALYLGSTTVTTDGSGNATISATGLLSTGGYVWFSATATSPTGATSEFSVAIEGTYDPGVLVDGSYDWHYEYDGLNRLTYACDDWDSNGETCNGNEWNYSYDGAGNLLSMDRWDADTQTVETVAYIYNGANQLICVDGNADEDCEDVEDVEYTYDAYGNLTDDGVNSYTYDVANRLIEVDDGVTTTEYTYNGDGDRVAQEVTEGSVVTTTEYVLDIGTPLTMVLAETTTVDDGVNPPDEQPTIYYLHGLDLVAQSDGISTEYFLYDALGSVRQLADDSANPLLTQTYDPYGTVYASVGVGASNYAYTGEQVDANGLIYLRARYYNPQQGRFLNIDPSRLERNPYLYGLGNPVYFIDPSGLCGADIGQFGKVDQTKTDQCQVLVEALESVYGINIYWPDRSDVPSILNNASCICDTPSGNCSNGIPEWLKIMGAEDPYNSQFKKWRLQEVLSLSMAIIMYRDEMGHNATRAAFESVLFVRADRSPFESGIFGQHWDGFGGTGITVNMGSLDPPVSGHPTIFLFDAGASEDDYPDQTWTFVHELGHRLGTFLEIQGLKDVSSDFQSEIWGGRVNPGTGPTLYAKNSNSDVGEDFAESVTVYLWDRHSLQFPRSGRRISPTPLLWPWPSHTPLDTARNDFVGEVFDLLRTSYP